MKRVFADSFYFFALISEDDSRHEQAVAFTQQYVGRTVTTGWVPTEVADGQSRPPGREAFLTLHARLLLNPKVEIVTCSDNCLTPALNSIASVRTSLGRSPIASPSSSCGARASPRP